MLSFKSAYQAMEYIRGKGIQIEPKHVYNIYSCGCVFDVEDDPQVLRYVKGTSTNQRECPEHKKTRLIIKYRLCRCGIDRIGKKLQASEGCKICHNDRSFISTPKGPWSRHWRGDYCEDINTCIKLVCGSCKKFKPIFYGLNI